MTSTGDQRRVPAAPALTDRPEAVAATPAPRPDATEAPPATAERQEPGWTPFAQVFRVFGSLVAPASLLTALLFYFGWAHVHFFWRYFGLDPSLLDFSLQDYLLRSVDALFVPLLGLAVIALLLIGGHLLVERWRAVHGSRRAARAGMTVLVPVGVQLVVLGFAGIRWPLHRVMHFLVPSTALGLGVVFLAYATHLYAVGGGRSGPADRLGPTRVLQAAAVSLVVALALFWATVDYALEVGEARARQFASELSTQPGVLVHSTQRLALGGPGVEEVACAPDAAYPFRYHGLKLMLRSGGQYFLLPEGWSRRDGVAIVLPAADDLRLEFTVGAASSGDPPPC